VLVYVSGDAVSDLDDLGSGGLAEVYVEGIDVGMVA